MALYRKYRPASFAEVVGQEHVTQPLSTALDSGRINHAYLFSGPRGCGKTSSARILARSLNCEQGPTSTPCGVCNSCVSLAPGGPGNLDVTELDAASHNGVEDMRELRDRAFYAPAESRYRVFIIDEAHMITNAGSNALLKIVEEPPAHLIFIFATTEPDKVIGTIRSRTHHYPFRLLTPLAMRGLLERTTSAEGVHVDDAVYPLVIRSGGGSPRDSLSILDQLLAGAGPEGLTYERALPLLGVTDSSLIDAAVLALAETDRAGMFTNIDHVVEAGHDPRRFATDLLDRLRDLMVLQAVPEALQLGLVDAPADRAEVLTQQASMFSGHELARLAALVNDGLDDMRGATSPRLLLEILSARMLLPSAAPAQSAPSAASGPSTSAPPIQGGGAAAARAAARAASAAYGQRKEEPQAEVKQPAVPEPAPVVAPVVEAETPTPQEEPIPAPPVEQAEQVADMPSQPEEPEPAPQPDPQPESAADPEELLSTIRKQWANLRSLVGETNKSAEIMLTEARVLGLRDDTLFIGHNTGALATRLNAESNNSTIVKVLAAELGQNLDVQCLVGTDPSAAGFSAGAAESSARARAWNPREGQSEKDTQEQPDERPEEPERPASDVSETPQETPAPVGDGWGAPRQLGGEPAAPEPVPEPIRQERVQSEPQPTVPEWQQRAQQAAKNAVRNRQQETASSFGDGVPLPPEPEDDGSAPPSDPYGYPADEGIPQPAQQSREPFAAPKQEEYEQPEQSSHLRAVPDPEAEEESEEEEMIREASEPGTMDRRDAKTIAMELLAAELGAKPL